MEDWTGAGGMAACCCGGAGGGAVLTASCLWVQAASKSVADKQANFMDVEKRIIAVSPGREDRRCRAIPPRKKKIQCTSKSSNALAAKKSQKMAREIRAILEKRPYWI